MGKLDKLVRGFLQSGDHRNQANSVDQLVFQDIQDPTFMTFKLSFFPDAGCSFPTDEYSAGGLFRKSKFTANSVAGVPYDFISDSAVDYLKAIGAPAKHAYLEAFITMLSKIESEAPWYFQSITGLGELWKIDPAQNYRAKDKVLTVECLESVDLRMTMLADLYRNCAFETEYMREVLPYNLRTFNMEVHVLEVRRFNTTFGVIADFYGARNVSGQNNQQDVIDAKRNSPYTETTTSTLNKINSDKDMDYDQSMQQASLGEANGTSYEQLKSAFEPVSVMTFRLKNCEFDFFSEAPGYLDTVSVKETPEATMKFKIKVGKIEKVTNYSFYEHVIAEHSRNSKMNVDRINPLASRISGFDKNLEPYSEKTPLKQQGSDTALLENQAKANSIFPLDGTDPKMAQIEAYNESQKKLQELKKQGKILEPLKKLSGGKNSVYNGNSRLERALTQNITNRLNNGLNSVRQEVSDSISKAKNDATRQLSNATNGLFGDPKLGNAFGKTPAQQAKETFNSFVSNAGSAGSTVLKNINFETLKIVKTIDQNVGLTLPPRLPGLNGKNVYGE